jgi:hypothetical protein
MKWITRLLAPLALSASSPCFCQSNLLPGAETDGPRAAVAHLLALNSASALDGEEGRALLAGELDASHRATFGPLSEPDRIVMLVGARAVARLPAEGDDRPDIYLYLSMTSGVWTIDSVRALALTGILRQLRRLLRASPQRTAQEEATLANAELVLASDRDLRTWFAGHRSDMQMLADVAERRRGEAGNGGLAITTADAAALLEQLHLNSLGVSRDGLVEVTIGGMVDNMVGFLHARDAASVPPIDPDDHIWIEPLGDGWYLFRTT